MKNFFLLALAVASAQAIFAQTEINRTVALPAAGDVFATRKP